jgi:phosphatidylglycerol---prolipoprotein diacylglyceryl transferase
VHPDLFSLGGFEIHSYGALYTVAYVVAGSLAGLEAHRLGQNPFAALGAIVVSATGALFGGRLAFWLLHEAFRSGGAAPLHGGTNYLGSIVGFFIAVALYGFAMRAWRPGSPTTASYLDILATAGALGHGIGRIGCFLAGCCYGTPTDSLLGVTYTASGIMAPRGIPSHPTQLYEAAGEFVLFGVLWAMRSRSRFGGQRFLVYVAGYAALRFVVEFFRGDAQPAALGLAVAQWVCLCMALLAVIVLAVLWRGAVRGWGRPPAASAR